MQGLRVQLADVTDGSRYTMDAVKGPALQTLHAEQERMAGALSQARVITTLNPLECPATSYTWVLSLLTLGSRADSMALDNPHHHTMRTMLV